jgi:large subunit ribosomal protein L18
MHKKQVAGQGPRFKPAFRRRRTGQTDYTKRLALLKGRTTRLVVRRSNRAVTVQFVDFDPTGDLVRAAATSRDLAAHGWDTSLGSTPAAYLTGLLAGRRAKKAGVSEAILDIGRQEPVPGGRLYAALKGVLDAGVEVPHGKDVLPDQGRLQGEHLAEAPLAKFKNTVEKIQGGA